ncbi:MAG: hypothetical protein U0Q15_00245 [Kineosporiaceae bacterium]
MEHHGAHTAAARDGASAGSPGGPAGGGVPAARNGADDGPPAHHRFAPVRPLTEPDPLDAVRAGLVDDELDDDAPLRAPLSGRRVTWGLVAVSVLIAFSVLARSEGPGLEWRPAAAIGAIGVVVSLAVGYVLERQIARARRDAEQEPRE